MGFELTTKDYKSDALHIVPRHPFNLFSQFFNTDNSFTPTAVCAITVTKLKIKWFLNCVVIVFA